MDNCGDLCDVNDDCIIKAPYHIIWLTHIFTNYLDCKGILTLLQSITPVEDLALLPDLYF